MKQLFVTADIYRLFLNYDFFIDILRNCFTSLQYLRIKRQWIYYHAYNYTLTIISLTVITFTIVNLTIITLIITLNGNHTKKEVSFIRYV